MIRTHSSGLHSQCLNNHETANVNSRVLIDGNCCSCRFRTHTPKPAEVSVEAPDHQTETLHSTHPLDGPIAATTTAVATLLKRTRRIPSKLSWRLMLPSKVSSANRSYFDALAEAQYRPPDVAVGVAIGINSGRKAHGVVQPYNLLRQSTDKCKYKALQVSPYC